MKDLKCLFAAFIILCLFAACASDGMSGWKETDLMSHGLPVKIKAPEDITVEKSLFSGSEEYQLSGTDGYGMNVLVADATSPNVSVIKTELKELVQNGKYFSDFIESPENGFIYKISIDSTHAVYGFRKIKIQGEKQIVFQNQYMSKLSEEKARQLFNSIPD